VFNLPPSRLHPLSASTLDVSQSHLSSLSFYAGHRTPRFVQEALKLGGTSRSSPSLTFSSAPSLLVSHPPSAGSTILQACEVNGTTIPRFCYHGESRKSAPYDERKASISSEEGASQADLSSSSSSLPSRSSCHRWKLQVSLVFALLFYNPK